MTDITNYVYKHLSKDEQHTVEALRKGTELLDNTRIGILPLTLNEYLLICPLFNPIVIIRNARQYYQLKRFGHTHIRTKRKIFRNFLKTAAVGFIPIFNVLWTRKFRCNQRNMRLVERSLRKEECRFLFGTTSPPDDVPLPRNVEKLFDSCPKYERPARYGPNATMELKESNRWTHVVDVCESRSSTDVTLAGSEDEIKPATEPNRTPPINTAASAVISMPRSIQSELGTGGDSVYEDATSELSRNPWPGPFAGAARVVRVTTVVSECTGRQTPSAASATASQMREGIPTPLLEITPESDTSGHELGQWREQSAESLHRKDVRVLEKRDIRVPSSTPTPAGWTSAPFAVARSFYSYLWPPSSP